MRLHKMKRLSVLVAAAATGSGSWGPPKCARHAVWAPKLAQTGLISYSIKSRGIIEIMRKLEYMCNYQEYSVLLILPHISGIQMKFSIYLLDRNLYFFYFFYFFL